MRILTLTNLYPPDVIGGYEVCCGHMVEALRARGHEVRVLTSHPRLPLSRPDPPHVHRRLKLVDIWSTYQYQQTLPVTAFLEQNESHRVSANNVRVLLDELESFRPDVVFLHMLLGVGAMGLLACLDHQRVPWVWQLGDDVPAKMCWLGDRLVPELARAFGRLRGGRFIAVSQQLQDAIERAGVPLNAPVELIPYGVAAGPAIRRSYHRPGQPLRLVTAAGVLDRAIEKGTDIAIESVALARAQGCDVSLEIYGEEKDRWFAERIRGQGLSDHVRLRGFLPSAELLNRYRRDDVFLFPTRPGEPFGVAPVEAAACGCVPLISSVCGLAEWVVDGVHVLKAPRNAEAFASVIVKIHQGLIELEPLARRAASLARDGLSTPVLIARTEEVLRAASNDRRGDAGSPAEAYRLAILAERLSRILIQQSIAALERRSA